ncbi:MAG: MBL fold metallo-hydrolase [Asgard group archaeon]|nr:MBL fold metallo-hydrolase [Asgard group archaeon]
MSDECYIKEITKRTAIGKTVIDDRPQSNAGVVVMKDYLIAMDPSPEAETAPIFRENIEKHYDLPVKYLFVTHYHNDHTKGMSAFNDCIIVTSSQLGDYLISRKRYPLPEIMFDDKLVIKSGPYEVSFHYAGGHTACSAYSYFPRDKVIFLGDLLFSDEFPWAGDVSSNPDQWIAVFNDILQMDFDYVVPGHGPLCDKSEIKKQLQLLEELRDNTIEAIKNELDPKDIKPSNIYEKAVDRRLNRTLRHFHEFYSKKIES